MKIFIITISALITLSSFAFANNYDVVTNIKEGTIIKSTFGNCVRTTNNIGLDKCSTKPEVIKPKEITRKVEAKKTVKARKPKIYSRSYLVFFDFDTSNITDTASEIIANAYNNATEQNQTNFEVIGHSDRSGSEIYNLALSKKRAYMVKDQLVSLGANSNNITVLAKGETNPLIQTQDGIREPQNRRVEIKFSILK